MARRVLLTGKPRVGKTTIVIRVADALRAQGVPVAGFYTEEVRKGGERVGFDVVTLDGTRRPMARKNHSSPMRLGSYGLSLENLDVECENLLQRLPRLAPRAVVVVDEIGAMELHSRPFRQFVTALFETGLRVLATVKLRPATFTDELLRRSDVTLVRVNRDNRDGLPGTVVKALGLEGPP